MLAAEANGRTRLVVNVDSLLGDLRFGVDSETFEAAVQRLGEALGFACDTPADVDAAWAEITGAGYEGHLAPWDAFWGMRYAVVHDPDGTPVDLFAPLPG